MKRLLAIFVLGTLAAGCRTLPAKTVVSVDPVESTQLVRLLNVPAAEALPSSEPNPPALTLDSMVSQQARMHFFLENYPTWTERHIIAYLIDSIRTSSVTFIRNGSHYTSQQAARWLRWKMYHPQFRNNPIVTGRDFIVRVATRSEQSHQNYEIILDSGTKAHLGIVLFNELIALETALGERALARALMAHSVSSNRKPPTLMQPQAAVSTPAHT